MPSCKIAAVLVLCVICLPGIANAQGGPKILTQFGSDQRSDRTGSVSNETVNGVRLYRGARSLDGGESKSYVSLPCADSRQEIKIVINEPFRRLRYMRTQGFFSGTAYLSRRFTQGFYSSR